MTFRSVRARASSMILLALVVVAIPLGVSSQEKSDRAIHEIWSLPDGGFVIFGQELTKYASGGFAGYNVWVRRVSADGTMLWDKILGDKHTYEPILYGDGEDNPEAIGLTRDGGFVVSASSDSIRKDMSFDAWIVRLDGDGEILWHRAIGGVFQDHPHAIIETSDGGFIAGGQSGSVGCHEDGRMCLWLTRLDSKGDTIWEKGFPEFMYVTLIEETSDGGFVITGGTETTMKSDVLVMKVTVDGEVEWSKVFATGAYDWSGDVEEIADGYLVSAKIGMKNATTWIFKLDKNGNKLWEKRYKRADAPGGNGANFIYKTDGGYFVLEPTWLPALDKGGVWIMRLDLTGRKLWDKVCGTEDAETLTPDGKLVQATFTEESGLSLKFTEVKQGMSCGP